MIIRFIIPCALGAALVLAAGCGTAEYDWNKAAAANTLAAYQSFVREHPSDKRADDARGRILALQDEQAWAAAQKAGDIAGYQTYLKTESGGVYAERAQYEIDSLRRAAGKPPDAGNPP
jgi:hypothetical protein